MNVLVLGASSFIGAELAAAFSPENTMILVGRNMERLSAAADGCRRRGARESTLVATDLSQGPDDVFRAAGLYPVDLIINAVAASSRTLDNDVTADDLPGYLSADLLAPAEIVRRVLDKAEGRPVGVIFVSTVLSLVRSPGRDFYSSLKRMQEHLLRRICEAHRESRLLIAIVGKEIPHDRSSSDSRKLAQAVHSAFQSGRRRMFHGRSGLALLALYYIQPLLFSAVIRLRRLGRNSHSRASYPIARGDS